MIVPVGLRVSIFEAQFRRVVLGVMNELRQEWIQVMVYLDKFYLLEPAFLMPVNVSVWREASIHIRTINPNIAFHFACLCLLRLIQTSLAALRSCFRMVSKTPSHSCTAVVSVDFDIAFRCQCRSGYNKILFYKMPTKLIFPYYISID